VIETKSQAVLNTHTEHDLQDAFKNGRSTENGTYARKATIWRVTVVSKSKVSFAQIAAPVHEIMDGTSAKKSSIFLQGTFFYSFPYARRELRGLPHKYRPKF
jgi:hypothetical protein